MARPKSEILALLKDRLQIAIKLEHSTIPPYLYAYWSIKDRTDPAATALFSIVKEEMLHMVMVTNILNAIGGRPILRGKRFFPNYPTALPGHDQTNDPFIVHLDKCSAEAIVTFMHIELPRSFDHTKTSGDQWDTIGEFYLSIVDCINQLEDKDFQCGRQAGQDAAPSDSGDLISVYSKRDALAAVNEIMEQGEGLDHTKKDRLGELAHFFRFQEIYRKMGGKGEINENEFEPDELIKKVDKRTYKKYLKNILPVVRDPKVNNADRVETFVANQKFNAEYSKVLDKLHYQFRTKNPTLEYTINSMFGLARNARALMSIPVDPNDETKGFCGPTFEYLSPKERSLKYNLTTD